MKVTGTAISLNVADPSASAEFLTRHVGHTVAMQADGFVSLSHPDGGPNVVYLRSGLPTFRPAHRAGSAGDGLLLVFVVDDVDAVYENVRAAGASVVTAPETEPWGERYCQFEDPNGIIVQFVTWV
ncbi:VOC family protein [Mycolicibacterium psychrotolerans]|uniref:Glyoxalase n=1 Tax=Mycolicibacterium psychrotolerans TaxID=216929 RepID=A0A7I7M7N4_9MYCO|nr:VOC family protein [Mycolicibacterium psychrotolerans]BBX68006.1 glyoxalase [Mycolicibacterium psychrotolerans]